MIDGWLNIKMLREDAEDLMRHLEHMNGNPALERFKEVLGLLLGWRR